MPPQQAAQIPAHSPQADPLSAFVATLTPDQRAALVRLLTPPPTG